MLFFGGNMNNIFKRLMKLLDKCFETDDFPVSAIIYDNNYNIIGEGYNQRNKTNVTTDHAEIIAINMANQSLNSWRLEDYNMIVTLEPCDMCKNVIKEARISNVKYLVKRYDYKKISKKTIFELYNSKNKLEKGLIVEYTDKISKFFVDKR